MKYKAVIFDLDGTLLDTLDDLGAAVNHALGLKGFPRHSREEFSGMVGHGVRRLVRLALPSERQEDEAFVDECLADFMSYYTENIDVHTKPYPGMHSLLRTLQERGVALAVASNKFQSGTERLVSTIFPDIRFTAVMGNAEGRPLKPDPEIVNEVLRLSGKKRSETVMVGDSRTDMLTAANGGIDSIAVSWGYRRLEGFTIAETASELLHLLSQ